MTEMGVSFSLHRCSELGLDKKELLTAAIKVLKFRRFRLMSYWNIHEQRRGVYDFRELDWQLDLIAKHGGAVSLCLGKRQPRWPECHMPDWAAKLPNEEWRKALQNYIEQVVNRYKNHPALSSWQLENEALLKEFGYCPDGDYSRRRFRTELTLVKKLDPNHPVVMTLSDSWGFPFRRPKPDVYAMSLYRITINKAGIYAFSKRPKLFYRLRAAFIQLFKNRNTFIHELQAEPWLKDAITKVSVDEQLRYMSPEILQETIDFAQQTGMNPIDLWGLEWWFWLKKSHDKPEIWNIVKELQREQLRLSMQS
ncbi:beta-galactosidase [Candidatus Saccharibacteria bacterium]|nr:beta-galactosidase [Candidatus Saccharibacteria bacterium]